MERLLLTVTLYTRKDCGLCDEAKAHLAALENCPTAWRKWILIPTPRS